VWTGHRIGESGCAAEDVPADGPMAMIHGHRIDRRLAERRDV
jgi:hypothetical protein